MSQLYGGESESQSKQKQTSAHIYIILLHSVHFIIVPQHTGTSKLQNEKLEKLRKQIHHYACLFDTLELKKRESTFYNVLHSMNVDNTTKAVVCLI